MKYIQIKHNKYPKVIETNSISESLGNIDDYIILNSLEYNEWKFSNGKYGYYANEYKSNDYAVVYISDGRIDPLIVNRLLHPVGDVYTTGGLIQCPVFFITKIDKNGNFVTLEEEEVDMLRTQFGRQSLVFAAEIEKTISQSVIVNS